MVRSATYVDRHRLILSTVTLNGKKARLSGIRNDFATITDAATGMSCEFSWQAVELIVDKQNGEFNS